MQAQAPPVEYVDKEFDFAFQVPKDCKFDKLPTHGGPMQSMRVLVRHPDKPMYVMATVTQLGKSVTKRRFDSSPSSSSIVDGMMELSVEEVYKRTSKEIGAERMIVSEKQALKSDAGIKFQISTLHYKDGVPLVVAGVHVIPFTKSYMVAFVMVIPVTQGTKTPETEVLTQVFNSFHILGERPVE
jgi:hypothetical protein